MAVHCDIDQRQKKYAKGRPFGVYWVKQMYGMVGKDEHPEIVHLMTATADDFIVKEKMQQYGL